MQAAPQTARRLQTHLELAALPSAVPCARGHVRAVALEWGLQELADTAELLASELVTNAIRASAMFTDRPHAGGARLGQFRGHLHGHSCLGRQRRYARPPGRDCCR